MDVSSIMSSYNLYSLWNSLNSENSSSVSVPLVSNLDSDIKDSYNDMNYFGETASNELTNLYNQIEPDYGVALTYDKYGNMSIPTAATLSDSSLSTDDSNILTLLNSNNSADENTSLNLLYQYNSIEDGTYNTSLSSILSSNPSDLYSTVNSLLKQDTGNNIDTTV